MSGRWVVRVVYGVVWLVLIGYIAYPVWQIMQQALTSETLEAFIASWTTVQARALYNSVLLSVLTVIGAGVLGIGLAFLTVRYVFPLRRVLQVVAMLPLALPPLVGVLAFLFLYGETGILPRILQTMLGLQHVPFSFEGFGAVWFVHVYSFYVYFYLIVRAALQTMDYALVEASMDMGASRWQTFRMVVFPLLRPALVGASLLVFMLSMASFTAPLLFGGLEPFLTVQIYQYKVNGNMEMAALLSLLLMSISVGLLLLLEWRSKGTLKAGSKGVAGIAPRHLRGWKRYGAVGGSLLTILLIGLPILTVIGLSFVKEGQWTTQILPPAYTLENYVRLFTEPQVFAPIRNSIQMAGLATLADLGIGVAIAFLLVRTSVRGRILLQLLANLPFAIPGTVIAISLILAFDHSSWWSFGQVLVGTFWMLPLAYFVRHLPLVVRSTEAVLESFDTRLLEAAADLGASRRQRFLDIVFPLIIPGVLAGALLTFVTALGEFVASILLYVYDNRPISVEIFSRLRLYDFGGAAAYSVFLMALILLTLVVTRKWQVTVTGERV